MSTTVERILAARDRGHRDAEDYALKLGLPLNLRFYCRGCRRHHYVSSQIGQEHERFGNPAAVRAAKRERLEVLS